jgi:hypothetical protein
MIEKLGESEKNDCNLQIEEDWKVKTFNDIFFALLNIFIQTLDIIQYNFNWLNEENRYKH